MPQRRPILQPDARTSLLDGVNTLQRPLRMTLGPHSPRLLVTTQSTGRPIKSLDDAALLSAQLLELPDPAMDVGHQMLRSALAELAERCDDGVATCAVLTQGFISSALRLLAAGHSATSVIEQYRSLATEAFGALESQRQSIQSASQIASVLRTATIKESITANLAGLFETIGTDGSIVVEETRNPGIEHALVRGGRWTTGHASPYLDDAPGRETIVTSPVILVSVVNLASAGDVVPALTLAGNHSGRAIVLIAPAFSDEVISLLLANRKTGKLDGIFAVKAPRSVHYAEQILEDIVCITGGSLIRSMDRSRLRSVTPEDLGMAARVWISRTAFGIVEGAGAPEAISARRRSLRVAFDHEASDVKREMLRARAGNLTGNSALVRVGSVGGSEADNDLHMVKKGISIARQALETGVLPGGGSALGKASLDILASDPKDPIRGGFSSALLEPMRVVMANSGREPAPLLDAFSRLPSGHAFNTLQGRWAPAIDAGLVDAYMVVAGSLRTAIGTACMAISTEVLLVNRLKRRV